ncbi:flagellar motor switch protein FliG [Poseidonocella pacifica]|uniref:flagellar motor switch protein FliG n=1 Tax=Poseidonocella pacifica TaxID=871651 RepID=UPI0031831F3A
MSGLSRKHKAAIIVRYLTAEGADIPLKSLPEDMQIELTQLIGHMRYIDRKTLMAVVTEFAKELDSVGLAFPDGLAGALTALDGKISPLTASRLRREAGVRQSGDPWERLAALEIADLMPFFESESTEVCAVLLSKLDVKKAAMLLGKLSGPQARRIAYAVSLTDKVTPDAVYRIGLSLASQLDDQPVKAFDTGPERRVGEILNFSQALTRDDVLEGLDETDQDFAEAVRRSIFTFGNIHARIRGGDIPQVAREADQESLVIALAYAQSRGEDMAKSAEFVLQNMSRRLADALRDEINELGKVKAKDGEEACSAVVGSIRQMIDLGELEMVDPSEVEEDDDGDSGE